MSQVGLSIEARDPLSEEALFLLHEAALEARELYQDLVDPATPMPTNQPLRDGDTYLIAFLDGHCLFGWKSGRLWSSEETG